ncbi:MAG: MTAP family purine nucleoside phosphorylase [Methanimicrococcus sp.]|nr:MTAP family purine nucleoside phosphorylase [Methanimicrococcus sp.]
MSFQNVVLTVIGGVGYGILPEDARSQRIRTPYGSVSYSTLQVGPASEIAFISRHQGIRHVPPHKINFRALIKAAQKIGAPVLAVNSVGVMRAIPLSENFGKRGRKGGKGGKEVHVTPETFSDYPFFVPNDFIDFTKNRAGTFYDNETVHADMTDPYCTDIRSLLKTVLSDEKISYSEGIYLCTEGPRFETKAEILMFSQFADVVGMTGVPEVCLAKEAGLCYASLCVITNPAAGLSQNMVTADEVKTGVETLRKSVFEIISKLARILEAQISESSSKKIAKGSSKRIYEGSSKGISEGFSKGISESSSKKISKGSSKISDGSLKSGSTVEKCRCKKAIDGGKL